MTSPELEKRLGFRADRDVPRHPTLLERLLFIIILCGIPAVIITALYAMDRTAFFGTPVGWVFAGLIVGSGILSVVIGSLTNLLYRSRVRKMGKADVVFRFSNSRKFRETGAAITGKKLAVLESSRCAVSASTVGMVVWAGGKPQKIVICRWADVHEVAVRYVSYGTRRRQGHRYGVQVGFTDKHGATRYLTFVNANVDLVPLPSKAAVEYVAAELNRLRAIGSTARVL